MDWMDGLVALAGFGLAVLLVYVKVRKAVRAVREIRRSRMRRAIAWVTAASIATTAVSCGVIEAARPSLQGPLETGTRAASLALGLLVFAVLFVRFVRRPEREATERFIANRRCPRCFRALTAGRVHHPSIDTHGADPSTYWFHRCECGEMTLYTPDGRAVHVEAGGPAEGRGPSAEG